MVAINLTDRSAGSGRATPGGVAAPEAGAVVHWLRDISRADVGRVGGKGANLGELATAGLPVPPAFVIDVDAWARFRDETGLGSELDARLDALDVDDPVALQAASRALRDLVEHRPVPDDLAHEIAEAYAELSRQAGTASVAVAVRSSATAEDTAQFSFAGMFESFLNVRGDDDVLEHVKACWASTFHARVLFYRLKQGMPAEMPVAVVVQAMVNSDKAGVMFTVDPATRDPDRIVIEAAWGLGEVVVLGQVTPDRYVLSKRTGTILEEAPGTKDFMLDRDPATGATRRVELLDDPRRTSRVLDARELAALGDLARRVEAHYGAPQDIEFAIDRGTVSLTQSRPVTTLGTAAQSAAPPEAVTLVQGLGASPGRATGRVRVLASPDEAGRLEAGEILVTRMTSPDWVPLMRRASAVVTDAGGMTSHAAIVSRELGIPCIVGAGAATVRLRDGLEVTVDGASGTVIAGRVPDASAPTSARPADVVSSGGAPMVTGTRLYVNLGEPERAEEVAALDVDGVGLLRAEFMWLSAFGRVHPRKLMAEDRGRNSSRAWSSRCADSAARSARGR